MCSLDTYLLNCTCVSYTFMNGCYISQKEVRNDTYHFDVVRLQISRG